MSRQRGKGIVCVPDRILQESTGYSDIEQREQLEPSKGMLSTAEKNNNDQDQAVSSELIKMHDAPQ